MAQVISVLQRKGGACKSTVLQCVAASMGRDGAKVVIVDTDPQASCMEWAAEQDIENVDTLAMLDEDKIVDVLEHLKTKYDAVLVDTAGYDSRMASYVIQESDLILIPSGGSKSNVMGAAHTWKHVQVSTKNNVTKPEARIVIWGVNKQSNVYRHAAQAFSAANMPVLDYTVGTLTGFEAMSWNGGFPTGTAKMALNEFMAAMQVEKLIKFYNDEEGAYRGAA